ncbi:peptidoglycan DD-metalloendopeptidase family protein [Rhodococcus aerolatus]
MRGLLVTVLALVLLLGGVPWLAPLAGAQPAAPPAPATAPRGGYGWPLAGRPAVVRPFDPPDTVYGAGHRGVDLAGATGQEVLAAGAGTVAFAGVVAGRGVVSVVHPDGLRTTYEPVAATVVAGAVVARGQVLGTLAAGHPGCTVAACLHWGVRRGAADYLDPLRLVGRWSVRLVAVTSG